MSSNKLHLVQAAAIVIIFAFSGSLTGEILPATIAGVMFAGVGYLLRFVLKKRIPAKAWILLKVCCFALLGLLVLGTAMNPNRNKPSEPLIVKASNPNKTSNLAIKSNTEAKPTQEDFLKFAKAYDVVDVYDYSFAGRKRIRWSITTDANDYNGYLGTAISAAKKMVSQYRAHQVEVFIEPSKMLVGQGYPLSIVTFTVDGKGNSGESFDGVYWEAKAVKHPYPVTQVKAAELWKLNRQEFVKSDGLLDEPKLVDFIAQKLSVTEDKIRTPWPEYTKVGFY